MVKMMTKKMFMALGMLIFMFAAVPLAVAQETPELEIGTPYEEIPQEEIDAAIQAAHAAEIATTNLLSTGISIDEDLGCYDRPDGGKECLNPIVFFEEPVTFTDDVFCYSSNPEARCTSDCNDILDLGCTTSIRTTQASEKELCVDVISKTGDVRVEVECENLTINVQEFDTGLFPGVITSYSNCQKRVTDADADVAGGPQVYEVQCPFKGKTFLVNGGIMHYGAFMIKDILSETSPQQIEVKTVFAGLLLLIFVWALIPTLLQKKKPTVAVVPKPPKPSKRR